ncbi:MAG: hypothetical protein RPT12_17260 [Vibrio anguillarum]|uniref:DUF4145 domain-containing protein n=2 Tax=Vibrio anguillarum TaxID=55601 RepID=A0AAW4BGY3_VIBAN|nr:hypothetical protein [Vibrio anguillarum]EKF9302916.1 hypothetical protein [Vibrio cholerae]MBF4436049.1 hypothetical protein [Vibrio anguillarum]MDT3848657.1 hypothetical protein [Vibrio anguillarum]NOI06994.1 hypothetical protein [Vibrio anguillarum]
MKSVEVIKGKWRSVFEKEDDLGVVLRAHIIIENIIEDFIGSRVQDVKAFQKMKLTFEQKKHMAMALGFDSRFDRPLKNLTTLRNKFAHDLRDNINQSDINNFYKSFDEIDKKAMNQQLCAVKNPSQQSLHKGLSDAPVRVQFTVYVTCLCVAIHSFVYSSM